MKPTIDQMLARLRQVDYEMSLLALDIATKSKSRLADAPPRKAEVVEMPVTLRRAA